MNSALTQPPKALLSWSSGKDSAMALYRILAAKEYEVVGLLTTISDQFHRVSMHGVREELLETQARLTGHQLEKVMIPYPCPNVVYEEKMTEALTRWMKRGVSHVIFGDLFLEDIRMIPGAETRSTWTQTSFSGMGEGYCDVGKGDVESWIPCRDYLR